MIDILCLLGGLFVVSKLKTCMYLLFSPLVVLATAGFQASDPVASVNSAPTTPPVISAPVASSGASSQVAAMATTQTATSAISAEISTPAPIPAPVIATAPAVPAPASPKFDMNEAASRYVALVKEADRISSLNPMSPDAIASSLRLTSRVSGRGITEGAGAYIALTAASHSEFASSLATVVNLLGRDAVLLRLKENPQALFSMINGYGSASKLASGALNTSVASLAKAQDVLGQAAYGVQKDAWSQRVVDTPATLAMVRAEAAAPTGLDELTAWTLPPRISDDPINSRFLLAASYRLLGDDVAATEILDKPLGKMCMNRVQLNVRQCIAASQYPYEHLFCLSRHSFGEAMSCVKDVVK
jgi:hypothetical protein